MFFKISYTAGGELFGRSPTGVWRYVGDDTSKQLTTIINNRILKNSANWIRNPSTLGNFRAQLAWKNSYSIAPIQAYAFNSHLRTREEMILLRARFSRKIQECNNAWFDMKEHKHKGLQYVWPYVNNIEDFCSEIYIPAKYTGKRHGAWLVSWGSGFSYTLDRLGLFKYPNNPKSNFNTRVITRSGLKYKPLPEFDETAQPVEEPTTTTTDRNLYRAYTQGLSLNDIINADALQQAIDII